MGIKKFSQTAFAIKKLSYFKYSHLPDFLQGRSKIFHDVATQIVESDPDDHHEAYKAMDRLLEAKDAYVRSFIKD